MAYSRAALDVVERGGGGHLWCRGEEASGMLGMEVSGQLHHGGEREGVELDGRAAAGGRVRLLAGERKWEGGERKCKQV